MCVADGGTLQAATQSGRLDAAVPEQRQRLLQVRGGLAGVAARVCVHVLRPPTAVGGG